MHRKWMRTAALVLAICGMMASCMGLAESDDSFYDLISQPAPNPTAAPAATAAPAPQPTAAPQVTAAPTQPPAAAQPAAVLVAANLEPASLEWTYPIPMEILRSDREYLVLVNKEYLLDSKYKPDDLEDVRVRKSKNIEIQLRSEANEALDTMFEDASTQGVTLYALSGFRSYQTQATMYENVGEDSTLVQAPGASDHQTGLGIDVISKKAIGETLNRSFENHPEAKWMAEHCWEYGFVIRYPKGKEDITGISFEPWHLRYVGSIEVAAYMMHNELTLEEFTAEWQAEMMRFDSSFTPQSADNEA